MWNKLYEVFCGFRGSCLKSDKLPHVMSLESAPAGAEDTVNQCSTLTPVVSHPQTNVIKVSTAVWKLVLPFNNIKKELRTCQISLAFLEFTFSWSHNFVMRWIYLYYKSISPLLSVLQPLSFTSNFVSVSYHLGYNTPNLSLSSTCLITC